MTYYISDLHFGHYNCLSFDNRPFKTLEEQNEKIVENWNKTVHKDDIVYILGDMFWKDTDENLKVAQALKGRKILIKGNHDHLWLKNHEFVKCFERINEGFLSFVENKKKISLCHYPIMIFDAAHSGNGIHLYGHIHRNEREVKIVEKFKKEYAEVVGKPVTMINVGCMMPYIDYTPRTLDYILKNCNMED